MRPKRLISLLVAVCMMITMLPLSAVTAFAEDTASSTVRTADDGTYKYEYKVNEDGAATITRFLGPVDPAKTPAPYDIEIPTELGGIRVTGLGESSFSTDDFDSPLYDIHHTKIQSVTIPESVTSIGRAAFMNCTGLTSLTIKGVATSIGAVAFSTCTSLTSLSLVGSFQTIGEHAFASCNSLTSLSLTGDVQEIGDYAFVTCNSLTLLSLTGDIQKIGDYAFYSCPSLKTVTLPKSLTSIGLLAFGSCTSLDSIEIPGTVTEIGGFAFNNSGLTSVTIDEGVKSTGAYMFYQCGNLTTVTLPESLTTIANGSFAFCPNLNHVNIPARVTCIGDGAFSNCTSLSEITLRDGLKTIGADAFLSCKALTSITLPDSVTDIGKEAFQNCTDLKSITIPKNVTTIEPDTFYWCFSLKDITLPAGLISFKDDLSTCTAGYFRITDLNPDGSYIYTPDGAIYYNNDRAHAKELEGYDVLKDRNFLCLCHVTFDANGGKTDYPEVPVYETEKIIGTKANKLKAIPNPTRAGYNFTGWYTDTDGKQLFNADETAITDDITLYAGWESDPNAPVCHPLTVTGGIVTVKNGDKDVTDTLTVTTDETTGKKTYSVPDGATVTVTLDKTLIPEGMVFDIWSTGKFSLPLGQDYKAETITFTMNTMSSDADIAAQYRDATIEDDGPNVLGTAAIIGTAAVGGAVLGYQAYSLGAEFAGKLMALPYFPSNRSALAMMLWEDAGKPMPESELLYPDVGQEEQDMDLQHAARWAMENELIPDLNDEGTAPEEMKFYPDNAVSKLDVLNAWQKAQELKNN
jgi:uncharacterized repeat protein (TIGR02543 family)